MYCQLYILYLLNRRMSMFLYIIKSDQLRELNE